MLNRICSVLLLKRDESGNSIEALLTRQIVANSLASPHGSDCQDFQLAALPASRLFGENCVILV